MADPSGGSITLPIIAIIIAALSFVVAALRTTASWYTAFAKGKLKAEMHKEYGDLSRTRRSFWETLGAVYQYMLEESGNQDTLPEELYKLALRAHPPHVKGDVAEWARNNLPPGRFGRKPFHKQIWKLASFVYPEEGDVDNMFSGKRSLPAIGRPGIEIPIPHFSDFHFIRSDLAWFWDKWMPLIGTRYLANRYDSAKVEVYLLVWLELALAYKIGQPGKGKTELFKFAGKFHSKI